LKKLLKIVLIASVCLSLNACGGQSEDEKKLIIRHIDTVETQVKGIDQGRENIRASQNSMLDTLNQMNLEIAKSKTRVVAARKSNAYLAALTMGGPEQTPGGWVVRNPAFTPTILLIILVLVLLVWLLWRAKQRQLALETGTEIDRVIDRLTKAANTYAQGTAVSLDKKESSPRTQPEEDKETPAPEGQREEAGQEKVAEKAEASEKTEQAPAPKQPEHKTVEKPAAPAEEKKAEAEEKAEDKVKEKAEEKKAAPEKTAPKASSPEKKDEQKPAEAEVAKKGTPARKTAKKTAAKKAAKKKGAAKKSAKKVQAKKCKVKGCNNKHRSKGFCNKHYQQFRRGTLTEEVED